MQQISLTAAVYSDILLFTHGSGVFHESIYFIISRMYFVLYKSKYT